MEIIVDIHEGEDGRPEGTVRAAGSSDARSFSGNLILAYGGSYRADGRSTALTSNERNRPAPAPSAKRPWWGTQHTAAPLTPGPRPRPKADAVLATANRMSDGDSDSWVQE